VLWLDATLLVSTSHQMLAYVNTGSSLHWTSHSSEQVRVNRSISTIMLASIKWPQSAYNAHVTRTCIDVCTWCAWCGFLITLDSQISRLENYPIRLLRSAYVSEQGSKRQRNNIKLITHTTAVTSSKCNTYLIIIDYKTNCIGQFSIFYLAIKKSTIKRLLK
jgi:hypothetical protein